MQAAPSERRKRRWIVYGTVLGGLVAASIWVNTPARERVPDHYHCKPGDLEWFRDAKFGLMITWGPVSLMGTEISWSRRGTRRGEDKSEQNRGKIPAAEYDELYRRFNPTRFEAGEYARLAQAAGARYVVFVAKHHDGFCMFDSALTDFKITRSPIGRDLTAELAQACHEAGLRLGLYYSPVDWHHPDYRTARHDQYIQYLHGQVRELCTRYGKVDLLWFDGLYWRVRDWDSDALFRMVRELQPAILINDRAGLPGDFHTLETEQRIGDFNARDVWETSMTLGEQWAYKRGDKLKSAAECIRSLVRCAGAGGNFLLNIGPDSQGGLEPEAAERLREVGRWLATNGRSIYGTRPGPFPPGDWGVSTHRGKTVYIHVMKPEATFSLPSLSSRITEASTLGGVPLQVSQSLGKTNVTLPPGIWEEVDTVVQLQLATPVVDAVAP